MLTESLFPTAEELAYFQAVAESGMQDTCTITRAPSTPTGSVTTVYAGKCQFKVESRQRLPADEPTGAKTYQDRVVCKIPISVTGVKVNDKITCNTSLNPSLVGDFFFVAGLFGQTWASAQRLSCERRLR